MSVMKKRRLGPPRPKADGEKKPKRERSSTALSSRAVREDLVLLACLEAYGAVRHDSRLADRALDFTLRRKKHLYSQERRAVAERVYALLRKQRLVDFLAEVKVKDFEAAGLEPQGHGAASPSRGCSTAKSVSAVVQALGMPGTEAGWLRTLPHAQAKLAEKSKVERFAIEASIPDFLAQKLLAELGDEADSAGRGDEQARPAVRRGSTPQGHPRRGDEAARGRRREGHAHPALSVRAGARDAHQRVRAARRSRTATSRCRTKAASCWACWSTRRPRKVIDACAGAGGKTLQLAAQMKNRG